MAEKRTIDQLPHHIQHKLCHTRPFYRQGKKLTSVKVYTVNDESQHLMICDVPKLRLEEEVKKLVRPYGDIKQIHLVPDYPTEEFTEAYHVQYARIQSARIAKRFVDGKNFYGGSLHVFYVPELESITETKAKLAQRRRDIFIRIRRNQQDATNPHCDKFIPKEQYHRRKKTPALPLTEERLIKKYPGKTMFSIYNGIPQEIDPRPVCEPSLPTTSHNNGSSTATENKSLYNRGKRKNYKGQPISDNVKVRIVRPQVVDTRTIVKWNNSDRTNVFTNARKVDSNITIKLIPKTTDKEKRIVFKDSSVTQLVQPSKDLQHSIQSAKCNIRAAMQTPDPTKYLS